MRAFEAFGGGYDAVVQAAPITDTVKEVVGGYVRRTIPRDTLVDLHGPWLFSRAALTQALDASLAPKEITTLVDLCRLARLKVHVSIQP